MTGIYATNSPEACLHVASDSRANIIVVEHQKQLEKILQVTKDYSSYIVPPLPSSVVMPVFIKRMHVSLQIKDQLPHLKAIVQYSEPLQEKLPNLYTVNV